MSAPASFSLDGQIALVLGGSSGIGRALAIGLGQAGATVLPAARRPDQVAETVEALRGLGAEARGYEVDACDLPALKATVTQVIADHGRIDLLINSQGTTRIQPALEFTEDDYDAILDTNLKSVFFACQEVGRHMIGQGGGCIISIASLAAFRGFRNSCLYTMSKHGVRALTEALASEWAPHGVRVNGIAPGFFMTEMNRDRMSQERKDIALSRTPMNRFGDLTELVGAAVYLASDAARFVTGETIKVDGGFLALGI